MSTPKKSNVTEFLLRAVEGGQPDRQVLDDLVPLVYDELRRMASYQLSKEGERDSLTTTVLVHEAYIKLVDAERAPLRSRAYFFAAAARAMRQVLVDAARRRKRIKRGSGEKPVTLDEVRMGAESFAAEVLDIDAALNDLALQHNRPAQVFECRFFGGLSIAETAQALNLSRRTVDRDWAFAQAWLRKELAPAGA